MSVDDLVGAVKVDDAFDRVVLDLEEAHIWDDSAVAAVDRIVLRLRALDVSVELRGLNEASASLVRRLAVHDKPGATASTH